MSERESLMEAREYVLRDECERRIDCAFKEAERYLQLSLLEAARADRAEAKLAALVGDDGPSSGAMESRHDSAARAASTFKGGRHRWPPPLRTWKSKRAWLRSWLRSRLREGHENG